MKEKKSFGIDSSESVTGRNDDKGSDSQSFVVEDEEQLSDVGFVVEDDIDTGLENGPISREINVKQNSLSIPRSNPANQMPLRRLNTNSN